ncbi:MAG: DNA repair protein RadA [Syntrophomonadaceae bacterium]|nr:DNA repair protein RadA [Syntrophomonadaceae bacterium]
MSKAKTVFFCADCGYESGKWLGRCPACGAWNRFAEEVVTASQSAARAVKREPAVTLKQVGGESKKRLKSGIAELDRVLGGGMVPGSLVLLGGDPGVGKSTLLLQVAGAIGGEGRRVLYLSGEESPRQIKLRAERLNIDSDTIYLLNEQNLDQLEEYVRELEPELIIIDSIQTVYSPEVSSIPGSAAQLRECTARLMKLAKTSERVLFLVGHVTKEGLLAGPKMLEHLVDVVIYFEGERNYAFRLLRGAKNRFGSTDEIGLLEMSGLGLVEVQDPSEIFLSSRDPGICGSAVVASFEGSRPLLIELQALVSSAGPAYGRRTASGIEQSRLALMIAVLEKSRGINLGNCDVYVKVTGGLFLKDPAVDLGIAAAVLSSWRDRPLPEDVVIIGELALSGELRATPFLDLRLREASRLGFARAVIPAGARRSEQSDYGLELITVKNLNQFIDLMMGG